MDREQNARQDGKSEDKTTDRDRNLVAYLDGKFEAIDGKFEAMQGQMDRRFEDMQKQMDRRFGGMQKQMNRRFDETDKQVHQTTLVVEDLRSEIKAVAEGHQMLDAKLDRYHQELKIERRQDRDDHRLALKELRRRDDALDARVRRLEAAASG